MTASAEIAPVRDRSTPGRNLLRLVDRAPFVVACVVLFVMVAVYAMLREDVLSIEEFNLDAAAAVNLILVATGQTIVLIRGGIDLSVGGMVSLSTVLAATRFGNSAATATLWFAVILLIGTGAGALNGVLISVLRLQPFLVTLATWSILSGVALLILPTDGGSLPGGWMAMGNGTFIGFCFAAWMLVVLAIFWLWFRASQVGILIKAAGSSKRPALLSGAPIVWINAATYGLSGLFAALASLCVTTQTGTGSPTVGKDYILASVAAAVIGGTGLFGGRGGLAGTVIGAFILTIIGNLVFVLDVSSYWQPIASGVILLVAVLASSLADRLVQKGRA